LAAQGLRFPVQIGIEIAIEIDMAPFVAAEGLSFPSGYLVIPIPIPIPISILMGSGVLLSRRTRMPVEMGWPAVAGWAGIPSP